MPNKLDVRKRFVSFSITREQFYKITQAAREIGIDRTSFCSRLFDEATKNVVLTEDNKRRIREEIKAEAEKRSMSVLDNGSAGFAK